MLCEAVKCLERIQNETKGEVSGAFGSSAVPPSHTDSQEVMDVEGSGDPEKEDASKVTSIDESKGQEVSSDTSKQVQESSSKGADHLEQPKDASASSSDPTLKEQDKPTTESPKDWFTRVTNEGHIAAAIMFCGLQEPLLRVLHS